LNVGQLGTRGLHTFQELAEFGESGEWIVDTVVDLQKRDERLAVGEQRRRVADPFGLRRIDGREHLLRRRLNVGDAFAFDLGLHHVHAHLMTRPFQFEVRSRRRRAPVPCSDLS
jgi:hypothetical protein